MIFKWKRERIKCEEKFEEEYRQWKRRWEGSHELESTKASDSWMRSFVDEQNYGMALLQQRLRLMKMIPPYKVGEKPQEQLREYAEVNGSPTKQRGEEINQLMKLFWKSNSALYNLDSKRPDHPYVQRFNILRWNEDRHGRSYQWRLWRTECADVGGCCGRACGCCEKPLLMYFRPHGRLGEKRLTGVYGHCTAECPCCIEVGHHCNPNPCLPRLTSRIKGTF